MKILVVEDSAPLADVLRRSLLEAGYAVDLEHRADSAIIALDIEDYDLIVLDILLPGAPDGGMHVCRHIRSTDPDTPILMLTALDSPQSRIRGLDAGADDYLVKPFHLNELLARVRALLRRAPRADRPAITVQDVTLHPATLHATRGQRRIPLTAKEFAVLEFLMRNADTIVSSSTLIDHAWDSNYDGYSNVVPSTVRHLRRKLVQPGDREFIETHRGAGYIVRDQS